jgi:hypothetical protein
MDISSFQALRTPMGQEALEMAVRFNPREEEFLHHFQTLTRHFPPEMGRAALETAILRKEGLIKFPFAEKMFFTRPALQQASGWEIACYRAGRYAGFERVFDMGCSIGSDTLALSPIAATTGIDLDGLRLNMAKANAESMGAVGKVDFIQADLTADLPFRVRSTMNHWALFFDPARREGERRIFSVRDYHPPLGVIKDWIRVIPALGVKISPGVNLKEIQSYEAEVEFISIRGELKEAVLWFGPLRSTTRRATLLPGPLSFCAENPAGIPVSDPLGYIYEPDPAVIRAGLVTALGVRLEAQQLDPTIAYLTGDRLVLTPFARVWKIETWFPFGLKRLRAYLRHNRIGKVTVKKRGSPLEPETLIHDLRLQGEHERVIFLTQLMDKPVVIVAYPENSRHREHNGLSFD